jgi:primosomal protein N' (replication factor Y) (superfamily II helicase)
LPCQAKTPANSNWRQVEIAVPLPLHHPYAYRLPERFREAAAVGQRVLAPFGNRRLTGYIVAGSPTVDPQATREILDLLDEAPLFTAEQLALFRWVAQYYMAPLGEVIATALPAGLDLRDAATVCLTAAGCRALADDGTEDADKNLLAAVGKQGCRLTRLARNPELKVSEARLKRLASVGWITRQRCFNQAVTSKTERVIALPDDPPSGQKCSAARRRLLAVLAETGPIPLAQLKKQCPTAPSLVPKMAAAGQVVVTRRRVWRDPLGDAIEPDTPHCLNREQAAVVKAVEARLGKGFDTFLLAGVTGSGKTEVYLQLAQTALDQGRTVLVLVPEIALITQTEHRFRARFGDRIGVLHSGLSKGERFDQWHRILAGDAPVVIGARSAIFAPLRRMGLIVVDEEHDASYKQDTPPFYNARDLAVVRARMNQAVAVLGSATPSLSSDFNAEQGKYRRLRLKQRVHRRTLPEITVVDLGPQRIKRGLDRWISPVLEQAIGKTLARGEQALLFLNRRGYASFPVCTACGERLKCRHCDITLTLHQRSNAYRCHYCGFSRAAAAPCPHCGRNTLKPLGTGTEKLEAGLASRFPEARVARMDRDTTRRKGSLVKLLKQLRHGEIDLLVGTQMVAKGHDFPNITLVGVICADLTLAFPDFRAGERTFQLLAQVAGRAGRGERSGQVILQTFTPNHFTIQAARRQDGNQFYQKEITFRRELAYPPCARMIQLRFSGRSATTTAQAAKAAGEEAHRLARALKDPSRLTVLGPIEAPVARIKDHYRWQLLLKGCQSNHLHETVKRLLAALQANGLDRRVRIRVDVDPLNLM